MEGSECIMSQVFFFQAEDGIRDIGVTGVQTCALPIYGNLASYKKSGKYYLTFLSKKQNFHISAIVMREVSKVVLADD